MKKNALGEIQKIKGLLDDIQDSLIVENPIEVPKPLSLEAVLKRDLGNHLAAVIEECKDYGNRTNR